MSPAILLSLNIGYYLKAAVGVRGAYDVQPNVQQQIARRTTVTGVYRAENDTPAGTFGVEAGASNVVASGDGWKLIHAVASGGEVDLDSIGVKISP